ncbi:O-acetylhomoserine aminocarboxypropyltransferase/cysteine synthase family protein [Dolosigranulum pigrum]|jgi:O-acetylhomoserine aminocarboxypropyltransferase/cysteine synthase|uniref:O-succinylhomoserine sulfhydrylase n=2 Tax=Dolosigranulum pigrum TaxID=29394 RepID=H3NCW6_9LACT|nr:O-acetylhomoserine aminocarboxypropyltransferase/cysteine synthase family protein [Dolosigranulum pigrum]EHR34559.1 O-acetylhomoserine aminocarboxypropyltransferase/cysteine synthase [Dolosigranulum pigrum ATCC 51524]OOL81700.1 O-acetylhomoserine aminocarboxypropyltransferase [Dolosigranulum pigrum]QTJ39099.1 O-acetylhomoserine aminocarboxypropyltransferase/cysteine synthase [Dolosigranulum pigrum]QTJ47588.1 O-acetylhomoserine aminocarboxypropyltransferase/cysteine synthase [Dolosigranulum p
MSNTHRFETKALHAAQSVGQEKSRAVPIHQTTSYLFDDTQDGAEKFALSKPGNIYTRLNNPTQTVFESRIAALEGGTAGLAVASGMAAISYTIQTLAQVGDHIASSSSIYGGTYTYLSQQVKNIGLKTSFFDINDVQSIKDSLEPETKLIFIESIGNPTGSIPDIEVIAEIAHEHGIPLVVDNTFPSPYLLNPIKFGADIVIHSATKFIGGHGTSIGGVIVESGQFDWTQNNKFPLLSEPDDSYHGLIFAEAVPDAAFTTKIRAGLLRDTGAAISPFNAFLLLQGVESLHVRVERHVENTEAVAQFLANHEKVEWVDYAGLADSPYYELKQKYLPKGAGSVFTFGVKGGYDKAVEFIEALELFSLLANVGDAKSLVVHPASMTHSQLTEEELKSGGIYPETIRVSIGIENVDDIIDDLTQALAKI